MARSIMDSILQHGRVVRGFLGVDMQNLDENLASKFKLKGTAGALIKSVEPKSPAANAGMEAGDVITAVNGKVVDNPSELRMTVGGLLPGTKVELSYLRDGESKKAEVTLAERPPDDKLRAPSQPETTEPDVLDGVRVTDIDETTRRKYGIPEDVSGVAVTEVQEDSPCAVAGLRVGDVIQSIERTPIKSSKQAEELSNKLKSEKEVLLHISTKGVSRYIVVKE
jgi:serine protease Do